MSEYGGNHYSEFGVWHLGKYIYFTHVKSHGKRTEAKKILEAVENNNHHVLT